MGDIHFTSAIADFDRQQFDALDRTAGFASSYSRLLQKERDARWSSRYLEWTDGSRLRAAIPVYRSRMKAWPDPGYDPRSWGLPDGAGDGCSPEATLMVGGCGDRRTGLHVDPDATPGQLHGLLIELARLAAEEERCLAFPYVYTEARNVLAAASHDRIVWTGLGREAHMFGLSDPRWESGLPSKVRNTIHRDRRKIAAVPMAVSRARWDEVSAWAAELISLHYAGKGTSERPEFVDLRYSELQENPDIDLFVFTAQSSGIRGVQTIVAWEDELEVYDVGLDGEEGGERFALYVNLLFQLPFAYARARGIDHVRLGAKAETPKAARGAVFQDYHGGVLSAVETRRFARGEA
ncbi:hypothetical protein [Actinacidiphila sp. bgisy144]|uniref:hypothetical protein n=1 Tax=Actinacidiphila sp. bgisy144 TaxID=3413791 RepID=UPI003EBB778A